MEESQGPGPLSSSVQAWFMTFSRALPFPDLSMMWEGLESFEERYK